MVKVRADQQRDFPEQHLPIRKEDIYSRTDLKWKREERRSVASRVLNLRDDQIAALFYAVGVRFSTRDIEEVVSEIRSNGHDAIHLATLLVEADSKKNLLWWVAYFEKRK
ncbi:hypothetical protein HY442_01820 [Candidatus Parcubacteria bacterium]|nr:hypothetical protein [Candidatus Parcubacteria bacterium]